MKRPIGTAIGAARFHDGSRAAYDIIHIDYIDGPIFQLQLTGTLDANGQSGTYQSTGDEPIRCAARTMLDRIELNPDYDYRLGAPIGTGLGYTRSDGTRTVFDIYAVNPDGTYRTEKVGYLQADDGRFHSGMKWDRYGEEPEESTRGDMEVTIDYILEIIALTPGVITRPPVGHAVGHEDDEGGVLSCYDILDISPGGGGVTVRRTGYLTTEDGTFLAEDHAEHADYTRAFAHVDLGPDARRLMPLGVAIGQLNERKVSRLTYDVFHMHGNTLHVAQSGFIHKGREFRKTVEKYPTPVSVLTIDELDYLAINN